MSTGDRQTEVPDRPSPYHINLPYNIGLSHGITSLAIWTLSAQLPGITLSPFRIWVQRWTPSGLRAPVSRIERRFMSGPFCDRVCCLHINPAATDPGTLGPIQPGASSRTAWGTVFLNSSSDLLGTILTSINKRALFVITVDNGQVTAFGYTLMKSIAMRKSLNTLTDLIISLILISSLPAKGFFRY